MSLNGMTADDDCLWNTASFSSILQTNFSRLLMMVWDWICSTLSLAPDNYSLFFPEGRPVGVMTISFYYFSSHLFFLAVFLSHSLCHPLCLFMWFFFLNLTLLSYKETTRVYAQSPPSLPSTWSHWGITVAGYRIFEQWVAAPSYACY